MTAKTAPTLLHVGRAYPSRQCHVLFQPIQLTTAIKGTRSFRSSAQTRADHFPDHYSTLGLAANSTPAEIKRQFYQLSKSNHPDLHPNDPEAAQRFVKISEAYAVLGAADKRAQYDRDYHRATRAAHASSTSSAAGHPGGSFSSASTPAGGRPASGLSRRRTQFRGPPPSFYKNGAWGQYGEKRSAAAGAASSASSGRRGGATGGLGEDEGVGSTSSSAEPGTGPGGYAKGFDNDVPHFDHMGHFQTHSDIERTRHRARRKTSSGRVKEAEIEREAETGAIGVMFNFFVVTGLLALVVSSGFWFRGVSATPSEPRRSVAQAKNGQSG